MSLPAFEIHDKEGKAMLIADLDAEACALWGKEVHPKEYAYPQHKPEKFASYKEEFEFYTGKENWFDKIGWRIANHNLDWEELKAVILWPFLKHEIPLEEIKSYPAIWGFIELIDLWESKGYTPVSIKE